MWQSDVGGSFDSDGVGTLVKNQTPAVCYGVDEEQNAHEEQMGCLKAREKGGGFEGSVMNGTRVRRLTPRECERLQGFPDDYTKISEKTADGPRYKALGNSMAVPVMKWIGQRIKLVEEMLKNRPLSGQKDWLDELEDWG